MSRYLVSGIGDRVAAVAAELREQDAEAVEVDDIGDVPLACAGAGPAGFDGYVQLPARFRVQGETAVDRVHHFIGAVLARFPAVRAALPALSAGARITFVMGVLPPEVSTEDDIEARAALVRVLGHAARADGPRDLRISVLGSGSSPKEIALTALGRNPQREDVDGLSGRSYADWRAELLGLVRAEM